MEISNLPDKDLKVVFIITLTNFGRRTDEYKENFNKKIDKNKSNRSHRAEEHSN